MSFLQAIQEVDKYFFRILNTQLSHPWLDYIMPTLTDFHRTSWALYSLPLLLVLWLVWDWKKCLKTVLGIVIGVALSDAVTYHLLKKNIQRDRPEKVMADVNLRTHSHSGYSFPSNHAANITAAAFMIRFMYPQLRTLVYFIALMIAYSRIYVGVHFPLDVLCGMIVGYLCGLFTLNLGMRLHLLRWKHDPPDFAKN